MTSNGGTDRWRPLYAEHPQWEFGAGWPKDCCAVVLPGGFVWSVREHIGIYWRDLLIRAHAGAMTDVDKRALVSVHGTNRSRLAAAGYLMDEAAQAARDEIR